MILILAEFLLFSRYHCGAEHSDAPRSALQKRHLGCESHRAHHVQILFLMILILAE
jgi:hypothetical protein